MFQLSLNPDQVVWTKLIIMNKVVYQCHFKTFLTASLISVVTILWSCLLIPFHQRPILKTTTHQKIIRRRERNRWNLVYCQKLPGRSKGLNSEGQLNPKIHHSHIVSSAYVTNMQYDGAVNKERTQFDQKLSIKYHYILMGYLPKQYWPEKLVLYITSWSMLAPMRA